MWNYLGKNTNKMDIIVNRIKSEQNLNESQLQCIQIELRDHFFPIYNKKWQAVSRKKELFRKKYATFLSKDFIVKFNVDLDESFQNIVPTSSTHSLQVSVLEETKKRSRPRLSYGEGSEKTKKRRVKDLLSKYSAEELIKAAECLQTQSDNDLKTGESTENIESNINDILAMYLDLDLTKSKYEKLRIYNKKLHGSKLYPPYAVIKCAKEKCYPIDLNFSDLGASVNVKSLLNHTTERILLTLNDEKLHELRDKELLHLYGKWGMDGASGQQTTRQKWSTKSDSFQKDHQSSDTVDDDDEVEKELFFDGAVFMICFVPIQLVADNNIVWKNEKPSSVNYCRPIEFEFIKESNSNTINKYQFYSDIFNKLDSSYITVKNISFNVRFNMQCTMIDGKTCNVLTNQKSSNCCKFVE